MSTSRLTLLQSCDALPSQRTSIGDAARWPAQHYGCRSPALDEEGGIAIPQARVARVRSVETLGSPNPTGRQGVDFSA
jgi:hypothetical protein